MSNTPADWHKHGLTWGMSDAMASPGREWTLDDIARAFAAGAVAAEAAQAQQVIGYVNPAPAATQAVVPSPVHTVMAARAQPAAVPVAALMRSRYVTTWAHCAVDGVNHYSEWGEWLPTTYKHAKACTDPSRNTDPKLYEMAPLYAQPVAAVPAQAQREPLSDAAPCTWSQDGPEGDFWHTSCGHYFRLDEGTPSENRMQHCCYCGGKLLEDPWVDEQDEDMPPAAAAPAQGEQQ